MELDLTRLSVDELQSFLERLWTSASLGKTNSLDFIDKVQAELVRRTFSRLS
jgi:hypothetical protein